MAQNAVEAQNVSQGAATGLADVKDPHPKESITMSGLHHRRSRRLIGGIVGSALTLGALSLGSLSADATVSPRTVGITALPWSYQATTGGATYTKTEAVAQAKAFNIIAANRNAYQNAVPAMRTANPDLKLLAYVNGAYAQRSEGTKYPDSWYLRAKDGSKVRSRAYGNFLMRVGLSGWIQDTANRCLSVINHQNYDGCFIDMMGTASIRPVYVNSVPINPKTGKTFTDSEWLTLTSALSAKVQSLVGAGHPVYINGLGSGPRYFTGGAPSLDGIKGALAESWLRGGEQSLSYYPGEHEWKQNIDMVGSMAARGKVALMTVKTWGSGTDAQLSAWRTYAIASYLMAADGKAQFSFLARKTSDPTKVDPMLAGLQIGQPTAAYAKVGGVYQRPYSNGRVLVNPTGTTQTVQLGHSYKTTSGNWVTSVRLTPNDAEILTAS
ncbi:MAG: hypothetical protein QOK15_1068 [Nocardioidaceae bacterium]|nr:hypothetical protein [Nocardioidaceae bacterium]